MCVSVCDDLCVGQGREVRVGWEGVCSGSHNTYRA